MVTIKDVAREAGVSVTTVSFAINNSAPVAPATKQRIMDVIQRLNYQPSTAARGLVKKKTSTICLFIPSPGTDMFNFSGNIFFTEVLQGIGEIMNEKDYNLLLAWEHDEPGKMSKALELAKGRTVDGILFMNPSNDLHVFRELIDMKFPFVFMGKFMEDTPVDTVDVDNFEVSYRITNHLIRLNHKRIAFISPGPLEYLLCRDRLEGYQQALSDANLKAEDSCVFIGDDRSSSGVHAAEHFFGMQSPPTAIVAGREIQAVGVIEYAQQNGISIPDDLSIVSLESSDLARKHDITAINFDMCQIGKESTRQLLKNIGRKRDSHPQSIIIPAEMLVRKTCGANLQ